jgi:hypothetical protein
MQQLISVVMRLPASVWGKKNGLLRERHLAAILSWLEATPTKAN